MGNFFFTNLQAGVVLKGMLLETVVIRLLTIFIHKHHFKTCPNRPWTWDNALSCHKLLDNYTIKGYEKTWINKLSQNDCTLG